MDPKEVCIRHWIQKGKNAWRPMAARAAAPRGSSRDARLRRVSEEAVFLRFVFANVAAYRLLPDNGPQMGLGDLAKKLIREASAPALPATLAIERSFQVARNAGGIFRGSAREDAA